MKILSPNLKKCLICSLFGLFILSVKPAASDPIELSPLKETSTLEIDHAIRKDLQSQNNISFQSLLQSWNTRFGSKAVEPLIKIASDSNWEDGKRYMALMGAARVGGKNSSPQIVPFLKDRSWMIRSAALRALCALDANDQGEQVLSLLKDPALVVRSETILAIEHLKPIKAIESLVQALHDPYNFHKGKAQGVPQLALQALVKLQAQAEIAPQLAPLLNYHRDPRFQQLTIKTLESITRKNFRQLPSLAKQVARWKEELTSSKKN